MSFYTFAAANLTTSDDHKRRPTVDKAQVIRMVAFCLTLAAALVVMAHRQSHAADSGYHGVVEDLRPSAQGQAEFVAGAAPLQATWPIAEH